MTLPSGGVASDRVHCISPDSAMGVGAADALDPPTTGAPFGAGASNRLATSSHQSNAAFARRSCVCERGDRVSFARDGLRDSAYLSVVNITRLSVDEMLRARAVASARAKGGAGTVDRTFIWVAADFKTSGAASEPRRSEHAWDSNERSLSSGRQALSLILAHAAGDETRPQQFWWARRLIRRILLECVLHRPMSGEASRSVMHLGSTVRMA